MYTKEIIHKTVEDQRAYFKTDRTLDIDFRIDQLKKLKAAVEAHEEDLKAALKEDLGRHALEAYFCDIGTVILEINEMIHGLKKFARPETHFSGLLCFPSVITKVYKMPYGVTLIISPFNFPIYLSLGVLVASIGAGNTAVIKTSSKTPNCTTALQKLIADAFPHEYVTVIGDGHDVADMCLMERFDKIFYTGSPRVAVHVMEMAAKNLTPVALELGGEQGNFCIVRKDADIEDAARKIAFFKLLNAGQICININQVAVAEEIADKFLESLKAAFDRQIGKALENPEYPKLVNRGAYDKCEKEAAGYSGRIVYGGKGDPDTCRFEPTVIYPVKLSEDIVNHELFCPLLPVVPYKSGEEESLLENIASREHGLSLYIFTNDKKWALNVMQTQQFGGGCINEVCLHMMVKGVPFGGTGHSGMGAYHGEWGFKEFTHPQTVLIGKKRFNLPLREHPYSGKENAWKEKFVRIFEK